MLFSLSFSVLCSLESKLGGWEELTPFLFRKLTTFFTLCYIFSFAFDYFTYGLCMQSNTLVEELCLLSRVGTRLTNDMRLQSVDFFQFDSLNAKTVHTTRFVKIS